MWKGFSFVKEHSEQEIFHTQMDWSLLLLILQNHLQLQCFPIHITYSVTKLHVSLGYRSRSVWLSRCSAQLFTSLIRLFIFSLRLFICLTRFFMWSIKTHSAQSSSKKCKNYLLKIYSQHINFVNTILNLSLWFICLGDPAMKSPSIPEKFNVKPPKNISCVCSLCFRLTRNVRFNLYMYKFKLNFLSRGQLESLNLDKILLPLLKVLPCYEVFLVT